MASPSPSPSPDWLRSVLPDFAPGPLDRYRRAANCDWRLIAVWLDGEEALEFKHRLWRTLESDPEFSQPTSPQSLDETRRRAFRQCKRLFHYNFLNDERLLGNPMLAKAFAEAVVMYDKSLLGKYSLNVDVFGGAVGTMSDRHAEMLAAVRRFDAIGCFALTEMAHGSDARSVRTTATYSTDRGTFVINTPDLEAMKIWVGNLGETATHAVVYAQLFAADGVCRGLHAFLVPIRDPKTLLPYPGVIVGDMGAKVGFNGVDNGFAAFDNYEIDRRCLLNKAGDVTPAGEYSSRYRDTGRRFGAAMGALSVGRVGIVAMAAAGMKLGVVIAVRYCAVRRQFRLVDGGEETPVIEHGMLQQRLLPQLAGTYAWHWLSTRLFSNFLRLRLSPPRSPGLAVGELHALSCAAKSVGTWRCCQLLQEAREACGGHGYLAAGRLGQLRADFDASVTYEGDNHVLLTQTLAWLLARARKVLGLGQSAPVARDAGGSGGDCDWSIGSADYLETELPALSGTPAVVRLPALSELLASEGPSDATLAALLRTQRQLVCWLLRTLLLSEPNSQELGKRAVVAFAEAEASAAFAEQLDRQPAALRRLCALHSLTCLLADCRTLLEARLATGDTAVELRMAQAAICRTVKDDAVALVDALAPTDFVLNSALGHSGGRIYANIMKSMLASPGVFERPSWWREFAEKPTIGNGVLAKL